MNKNKNNSPYGHLLDKYLDGAHFDYRTEEQKKEEERARYGNLLDNTKPDNSIWDNMLGVYESCERMTQRRKEEGEMFSAKLKERIERERREEEEHIAEVTAYAESVMAKKREEQEAKARAEEKRRKEAEETQKTLDRIQWMTDMSDFVDKATKETAAMLAYQKEKDEKHKKEMEWYEKQREYMKKRQQ